SAPSFMTFEIMPNMIVYPRMWLTETVTTSVGATEPCRIFSLVRSARALRYRLAMAGLLARGSPPDADLPGFPVVSAGNRLTAHSCGGSHGFGPFWVVRTVFPINPLESIRRGTIVDRRYGAGSPSVNEHRPAAWKLSTSRCKCDSTIR